MNHRVLIHIPARAGSKRLPGKNMRTVGGKSLVARATECGREFRRGSWNHPFDGTVFIDTDSQEIADEALANGAECWLPRLKHNADDTATTWATVMSAVERIGGIGVVVLLQPTSPLRTAADVGACWDLFCKLGAGSVATVEQGKSTANGAVYIADVLWLRESSTFFSELSTVRAPMPAERSVDINTIEDLERAEALWQAQHRPPPPIATSTHPFGQIDWRRP